jgi:hypothetical protein
VSGNVAHRAPPSHRGAEPSGAALRPGAGRRILPVYPHPQRGAAMHPSPPFAGALALALAAVLQLSCAASTSGGGSTPDYPGTDPSTGPAAGNPAGAAPVPAAGLAEDVSTPDHVVGDGTPETCTAEAFIQAVALGGKITFRCGSAPATIVLTRPAKVFNDRPDLVVDGGGLVTLSGSGSTRILYMNTCDPDQVWTTSHCQNQDHPILTVQNLTFVDGNSKAEGTYDGGGAIWARGGRLKVVNCRFFNNVCADTGPDVGGGAIRAFSQYENRPIYVVHSTFGGAAGYGNAGANGGALSSIGVSWSVYNSLFSHNRAVGNGGNPARGGTPGGGSGGAIYNDGNTMTLALYGSLLEQNQVNDYGSAIFFVSNDVSGTLRIHDSTLRANTGGSWEAYPGISLMDGTATDFSGVSWE